MYKDDQVYNSEDQQIRCHFFMWDEICICMNLCGVAVLELDSHPDHNKGPDHASCDCPKTHPIDHRSCSLMILIQINGQK